MNLLLPLTKGHLSNVATIVWQIEWPYQRETAVLTFRFGVKESGTRYFILLANKTCCVFSQ